MAAPPRRAPVNPASKLVYDKPVTEWSARYKKNKSALENVMLQCEQLRHEVAKYQETVDAGEEELRHYEKVFTEEASMKLNEAKEGWQLAQQQRNMLTIQLGEQRKLKTALSKEKAALTADYDRKYAELNRTIEQKDRLDDRLNRFTQSLTKLTCDRRRDERELDLIQSHLRENTDIVDELSNEMYAVREGIKDSVDMHMPSPSKYEGSQGFESTSRDRRGMGR